MCIADIFAHKKAGHETPQSSAQLSIVISTSIGNFLTDIWYNIFMKLNDVMKDSKIKIHANINGHGILLITKAEIGVRDGLLVDSLTYFDEDLIFRDPVKIVAINKRDGRAYEFESQSIGPVETRYGKFHLIRCPEEGAPVNRRHAERYDIDKLGVIKINRGRDIRNALIYDISMKGVSFILDQDAVAKVGDHISASFRYDPTYFHFYSCEATVVRSFKIDDQPAIGCSINSMGADLVTLISNKRREKAGFPVDDMLGLSRSSDDDIASGDKIPVNYAPPVENTPQVVRANASRYELPMEEKAVKEKPPATSRPLLSRPAVEVHEPEIEYLSPEEAADLIPERSTSEIIREKLSEENDISSQQESSISAEDNLYLEELRSIEDRSPKKVLTQKEEKEPAYMPVPPEVDPAKTLANAANAAKSRVHLPQESQSRGFAIDEDLLSIRRDDGFLTPDQIADIIELERISKNS